LEGDERRVYDLVVKRFLAVLSPAFEYEQTTVSADIAGELFTASGKIVQSKGWRAVYGGSAEDEGDAERDEREQTLPAVSKGDTFAVRNVKLATGKTKPPARYTEATLLTAMEHPGKFIENNALRSVMDTLSGIGTPATRADIIEKLFAVNYLERRGNEIFPLSKGVQLVELVPEELRSPELTAKWEQRLTAIGRGAEPGSAFIAEMRAYASKLVGNVIASDAAYHHDNMTHTPCPQCGKFLLEINGKKGNKMLVCPDRECGYRQNVSYLSNARCPVCHKKLEVFGEGEKKLYTCHCGFREKADAFAKRMSETHDGVSKHEVQDYLRRQEADETKNSAFAQAWAKANGEK
ncbi:MAG: DNA topoisomerase, partial [Clostridia bacterium]|nr:DNA topoisomerase [Clostridia bacterium]